MTQSWCDHYYSSGLDNLLLVDIYWWTYVSLQDTQGRCSVSLLTMWLFLSNDEERRPQVCISAGGQHHRNFVSPLQQFSPIPSILTCRLLCATSKLFFLDQLRGGYRAHVVFFYGSFSRHRYSLTYSSPPRHSVVCGRYYDVVVTYWTTLLA